MAPTVVITGAGGNLGGKLRRHFGALGWTLRLLDVERMAMLQHHGVRPCGLGRCVGAAVCRRGRGRTFRRAAAAGRAVEFDSAANIDLTLNVYRGRGAAGREAADFRVQQLDRRRPPFCRFPADHGCGAVSGQRLWGIEADRRADGPLVSRPLGAVRDLLPHRLLPARREPAGAAHGLGRLGPAHVAVRPRYLQWRWSAPCWPKESASRCST